MVSPESPSYPPQPPQPPQPPIEPLPAPTRAATPAVAEVATPRKGPGWGTYLVTVMALVVLAAVVVFVLQNTQPIDIKFLTWKHHFDKTSWVLGAVAVGGLIVGLFLGLIPRMTSRRKQRAARRSL
jgi:uncharacterized integral membrane protein